MEENNNKHAPCLDKNCSFCCNPVKMSQRAVMLGFESPKDREGNNLWQKRDELLRPVDSTEINTIATFDCKNYDTSSGKCLDYDNRPKICRNTTCIQDESGDIDEQHKKMSEIKFVKLR